MRTLGTVTIQTVHAPGLIFSALALLAVAVGLIPGYLGFDPAALGLMSLATILALVAARSAEAAETGRKTADSRRPERVAAVVLVGFCVSHQALEPGIFNYPVHPAAFRALGVVAAVGACSYLAPFHPARWLCTGRFLTLVGVFAAMASVVVVCSPFPKIDVWWLQQYAASLFARGDNPYVFSYPNVYEDASLFGEGFATASSVHSYPYLPLTFMLGAPFVEVLLDVRFLMVAMTVIAAITIHAISRDILVELCCLGFLFQPRSFFVVEQAWTEPIVLAALAATVLMLTRVASAPRRWIALGVAGGVLVASKQYSPFMALPLLAATDRNARWRALLVATAVAAATIVPFVVLDASEFWRDAVAMQFAQPFRSDALSWLVPISALRGGPISPVWGFAAAATVFALLASRLRTPAGALRVMAAAWLAFIIFNKQAFANYYWLGAGLLLLSIAAAAPPRAVEPGTPAPLTSLE